MDWRAKLRDSIGSRDGGENAYSRVSSNRRDSADSAPVSRGNSSRRDSADSVPVSHASSSKRASLSSDQSNSPPPEPGAPDKAAAIEEVEATSRALTARHEKDRILDIERVIMSGIKYWYSRAASPEHHDSEEHDESDPFIEQFLVHLGEIIESKVQKEVVLQMSRGGQPEEADGDLIARNTNRRPTFSSFHGANSQQVVYSVGKNLGGMMPNAKGDGTPAASREEATKGNDESSSDSEEEKEEDASTKLSDTKVFQFVTLSVIAANTIVIALEAHYIADAEQQAFFRKLEFWFCICYIVELFFRFRDNGAHEFFFGHNASWNWFDFLVTILGALTILLSCFFNMKSSGTSVIRLFRMLRMLRIFRAMKFIKDIEQVVAHAFRATMKLFFIAFIVVFLFGIMFCNLLYDTGDPDITASFGNLELSMWSMFRLMTMDDWVALIEPTIKYSPNFLILFIFYIFLASIALMSLVPAIFVEQSMTERERAKEKLKAREEKVQFEHDQDMLHALFKLADSDNSGSTSLEELKGVLFDPAAISQLKDAGLTHEGDIADVTLGLFDMLEHLIEEHDHAAIQTTEKQFAEGVFKQRDDDSKAASWRTTTAIRMQVYRFTTKLRLDIDKIDNKIDGLRELVMAYMSGGPVPSPRDRPAGAAGRESSWNVWDAGMLAAGTTPGPSSRGGAGDDWCGNPKKSPRACGDGIFG